MKDNQSRIKPELSPEETKGKYGRRGQWGEY
jgi:hypothetical protein